MLGLGIIEMLCLKNVSETRIIFGPETGAKIKLGLILNDIRGSIGNYTYSIWKAGVQVLRSKASVIANPQSIEQTKVRCNFAVNSAAWKGLTPAQQAEWQDWADTKPGMGDGDGGIRNLIKGNGGIMSGWNAFCLANQWLVSADLPAVTAAPLGVASPGSPSQVAATYAANAITVTWVDPAEIIAGDKIRIWLMSRNGLIHKQLNCVVADAIQTKDITTVQAAGGLTVPVANYPGDYLIQLDCVTQTGVKGGPSNTAEVTVT
jgi:hypothetical protein